MEWNKHHRCRVLFLIPTLRAGGAERVMTTLLPHFNESKFDITLGVLDASGADFRDRIPPKVAFFDLGATRARYALCGIVRLVWKTRPDVVFSFFGYLNIAVAGLRVLFPCGVRLLGRENIVVSRHLEGRTYQFLWEWAYRWIYPRLDYLVSQSTDMRDDLVARYRFPKERIGVISNPVDVEYVRRLAEQPCVEMEGEVNGQFLLVAAGRLERQKGFDLLLQAIALYGERRLHLFLLGEGSLADDLKQLAKTLGIEKQISFVGFQKNPYAWFVRANAFILSSRYEGFPNVVIEAMACGTPVIATPAPGGTREILEAIPECELATDISAQGLATAIERWREKKHGRLADSVIQPYLVASIVNEYEERILQVSEY